MSNSFSEFNPQPMLASVSQVVAEFGMSKSQWRALADSKKVRVRRINGQRWFFRESCWRFVHQGIQEMPESRPGRAAGDAHLRSLKFVHGRAEANGS
jgi:hypothetical protein